MRRLWLLSVFLEDAAKPSELPALQTLISFSWNSLPVADVASLEKWGLIRQILFSERKFRRISTVSEAEQLFAVRAFAFSVPAGLLLVMATLLFWTVGLTVTGGDRRAVPDNLP